MIQIYTDGACIGNPGRGGWAYYIPSDGYGSSGHSTQTTNNQMELKAAIEALKTQQEGAWVEVLTDSKYVTDAFSKGWVRSWLKNNYKKGKLKNIELWKELIGLAATRKVTWTWVKGHSGISGNEMADRMATDAAKGTII